MTIYSIDLLTIENVTIYSMNLSTICSCKGLSQCMATEILTKEGLRDGIGIHHMNRILCKKTCNNI